MLGNFGNFVSFDPLARSPLPVGRVDFAFEASGYFVSEIAFGPLTLAAYRCPERKLSPAESLESALVLVCHSHRHVDHRQQHEHIRLNDCNRKMQPEKYDRSRQRKH